MEIIALSGFARVGKDEAAAVLVEEYGFVQVAFADKLREMLYQINPIVDIEWYMTTVPRPAHRWRVQDVIDLHGWSGYKETRFGDEIRRLLQTLGTEAGRQTLWDTIWIDAALTGLDQDAKVVVSDARFFNEFDAVRERGGRVWRIEREGIGPQSDHASEIEAISYPHFLRTIHNNGTLEEYKDNVRKAYLGDLVAFEFGEEIESRI